MEETELGQLARDVVELMWRRMAPQIQAAWEERLIHYATHVWQGRWQSDETMTRLLNEAVDTMLRTTFKPALDEIARRTARQSVARRAKQKNVDPLTLPGMEETP